jgi:hypothetical protein
MAALAIETIQSYRSNTFRLRPGQRIQHKEEAVQFVRDRGFVFFWPIKEITLPSLWVAVAGDRPVADAHDDPGHVTWGWKDSLLGKHEWYYAKVLRKRATMISMELAPYFYALTENYGSPDEDYLTLYEMGRLTLEARQVYEALLREGPLDSIALRKAARLSSRESEGRFSKAITDLQADFKVVPVAVTNAGACAILRLRYRRPPLPGDRAAAHAIGRREARLELLSLFPPVGAARPAEASVVRLALRQT